MNVCDSACRHFLGPYGQRGCGCGRQDEIQRARLQFWNKGGYEEVTVMIIAIASLRFLIITTTIIKLATINNIKILPCNTGPAQYQQNKSDKLAANEWKLGGK